MLSQRRVNQLDYFISNNHNHNNKMVSPRNNRNFQPTQYYHNYQPQINQRPISPNRIVTTKKPIISKSPKIILKNKAKNEIDHNRQFYCSNESHRNKKAQYMIHIEDQFMYYCGVCATQAASQGFNVNRINNVPQKKQKNIPYLPNHANNKRYIELTGLMKDILKLENEFKNRDPKEIKEMYGQQTEVLNTFYDNLVEVIERMRSDHLQDFKAQQMKSLQSCEMYYENLKMHMDDLNEAWNDIEQTIQDVVERVDASDYQEGIRAYRNTLNIFKHKIQEYEDNISNFTTYEPKTLENKVKAFENNLMDIWEEQDSEKNEKTIIKRHVNKPSKVVSLQNMKNGIGGMTLKNVHENLPKSNFQQNGQGQGAFRNLFPQESMQDRLPEASPQFKNF